MCYSNSIGDYGIIYKNVTNAFYNMHYKKLLKDVTTSWNHSININKAFMIVPLILNAIVIFQAGVNIRHQQATSYHISSNLVSSSSFESMLNISPHY